MHALKIPSISSFDKLMTGSIQKGRCEKIACMVYHVIPAEAGIQDPQGDMNILDSGDPVPAKAGNRSDAQTAIFSQHQGDEEAVRQLRILLPMEGERLEPAPDLIRGEGVHVHRFAPSPHPSPSRAHHCTHLTQGVLCGKLGSWMFVVNIFPNLSAIGSRRQ